MSNKMTSVLETCFMKKKKIWKKVKLCVEKEIVWLVWHTQDVLFAFKCEFKDVELEKREEKN